MQTRTQWGLSNTAIVVIIVGCCLLALLVAAAVGVVLLQPHVEAGAVRGKRAVTERRMRRIGAALDGYERAHGGLPQDLLLLQRPRTGGRAPLLERVPTDAWGGAFAYRVVAGATYQLRSDGPDRTPATEDDFSHLITLRR